MEDEERLHAPERRENFIERIFTYRRWRRTQAKRKTRRNLIQFHAQHKLIILAHDPKHYRAMEKLVSAEAMAPEELYAEYQRLLMEVMRLKATASKNTAVLRHIMGHIKKKLSSAEKQELQETIDSYRQSSIPLLVPVTLLNQYLRKYHHPYLKEQYYLHPHPVELKLKTQA